ncbi:hypothetical protein ACH4YO_36185 [Streptomyces noursei]|uniref:hypothetical protein n=1 Tax=Streptomyces noursei TaxID=1971 RepID=UPI0033F7369F
MRVERLLGLQRQGRLFVDRGAVLGLAQRIAGQLLQRVRVVVREWLAGPLEGVDVPHLKSARHGEEPG